MRRVPWPWVVSFVVAFAVLGVVLRPRATLESVGRRAIDCTISGDPDCLFALTTDEERAAYGLTPRKLEGLWATMIKPHLRVVKRGEYSRMGSPRVSGNLGLRQEVLLDSGRRTSLSSYVQMTDSGPKCPNLVTSLWLASVDLRRNGVGFLRGAERIQWLRDMAIKDKAAMEHLGLPGFYESSERGLVLWDTWIQECDSRIERLQASARANHK
ncbi:MAG: hypothetical protein IT207_07515 [Fimbriimonadaceae bacterium]|nr:hypothetical protein [Fimbriimonadaceae bacterium]